jgi:hypothetical protein
LAGIVVCEGNMAGIDAEDNDFSPKNTGKLLFLRGRGNRATFMVPVITGTTQRATMPLLA